MQMYPGQTDATSVIMHPLGQTIWKGREKKVEQMQPVCLCILFGGPFEEAFKTHTGKRPSK